jgi:hypothetical protein
MCNLLRFVLFFCLVATLSGCAFGQKISYTGVSGFYVPPETQQKVALAVSDKRPAIVSGDHSLQWVGYSRPPLGIPYGVHTASGRPLSDDFASLLQSSLAIHGIVAQVVSTQPFEERPIILQRLGSYNLPAGFLVTLNEWKTDSYVGLIVSLYYSVTLEALDAAGRSIGLASTMGVKDISRSYPLDAAVRDVFNELFNSPQIAKGSR